MPWIKLLTSLEQRSRLNRSGKASSNPENWILHYGITCFTFITYWTKYPTFCTCQTICGSKLTTINVYCVQSCTTVSLSQLMYMSVCVYQQASPVTYKQNKSTPILVYVRRRFCHLLLLSLFACQTTVWIFSKLRQSSQLEKNKKKKSSMTMYVQSTAIHLFSRRTARTRESKRLWQCQWHHSWLDLRICSPNAFDDIYDSFSAP